MNALLKPIEARAVTRPTYDNTYLGYEADWITANALALATWWEAGERDEDDFALFCGSQHDIELAKRNEFKQTLRMYE